MNDYLWLALIELSALAILETFLIAILLYRQRKINATLQAAAEELRNTEEDRRRTLSAILSGVHLLPEDISAELSTQLMQCERTLLRQCFDILLSHDPASAARLSDTVLASLDDYLRKCAVPHRSRTVFPAPESVGEEVATAPSGEKLPYWMNKFEQGKFLPEGAPAETALPVESEENIAASPVAELAESADPPVEIEPAETPGETTLPTAAEDYTEQIGDLLDVYENHRDCRRLPNLAVAEPANAELPAQTATEPPSQPVATVDTLLAEFGLTSSATPAPADKPWDKTPLETVESAPAAHPDDVEALLTEFGFHSEPKPEIPDVAPVANPEEVAALLAEFGLVPDGTEATEPANVEPEQGETAATKRRGRRKSEAPG